MHSPILDTQLQLASPHSQSLFCSLGTRPSNSISYSNRQDHVHTVPMFILYPCSYCTHVHTVPMFILYPCSYCTHVHTVPMFILYPCSYCTHVHTVPMFPSLHPSFFACMTSNKSYGRERPGNEEVIDEVNR